MPLAQTIGLDTLSKYFHLPINDVAKELGVCATVLKKICRKNGIPRWPHRKIKSLDKMIMTLEVSVAKNPEDGERIRHEIHTLKNKKMFLMKNPNVLATKAPNMKKGPKSVQKLGGNKSPIDSPESPSNRNDHTNLPFHTYNSYPPYPPTYPNEPQYPSSGNAYNTYNSYPKHNPAGFHYYPYPSHYQNDSGDHRRVFDSSEECLSPSMVLDPVAAALFLQIPHPHLPHSSSTPRSLDSSPSEKSQWVPGDLPSAFTPKSLRNKLSPSQPQQGGFLPDLYDDQARVPQHSPHHPSSDYLIQLPELRLPDEKDKPKLSTLEPDLFHHGTSGDSSSSSSSGKELPSPPTLPSLSPSPSNKWQLPEWFEAEHQHIMRKEPPQQRRRMDRREDSGEVCVPMSDLSPRTSPPLSVVGE